MPSRPRRCASPGCERTTRGLHCTAHARARQRARLRLTFTGGGQARRPTSQRWPGRGLMANRAPRPCAWPGCPELARVRYCDAHLAAATARRRAELAKLDGRASQLLEARLWGPVAQATRTDPAA